jgi:hypothetical protein
MQFPKSQKLLKHFLSRSTAQKISAGLAVVVVAGLGAYLIAASHAASPYTSIEAASGTVANGACLGVDSSASNGRDIQFNGAGSICPSANPIEPSGAFSVTAPKYRAVACDPPANASPAAILADCPKDATAGIQAAISAAQAAGGNQTVYFPAGTYILNNDTVPASSTGTTSEGPNVLTIFNINGDGSGVGANSVINLLGAGNNCANGPAPNCTEVIDALGVSNNTADET